MFQLSNMSLFRRSGPEFLIVLGQQLLRTLNMSLKLDYQRLRPLPINLVMVTMTQWFLTWTEATATPPI